MLKENYIQFTKKEIDYFSDWVLKNKFLRAGRRLLALF